MGLISEASGEEAGIASILQDATKTISEEQTIVFRKYTRKILPLDGFAFWVLSSALPPPSEGAVVSVQGSLHYRTDNTQDETEGFATDRVIFTSLKEIEVLNDPDPQTIFIGEFDGLKFAFSHRALYRQAGIFHYEGYAVYPTMETQIVDSIDDLDLTRVVVSNSLPIWLTLDAKMPMYPSYLIPDNIAPPYCAVHVEDGYPEALQGTPYISGDGSHYQLVMDRVTLTIYGLRNGDALDFIDYVNAYSVNYEVLGLMNMPVVRDLKRTQAELNTIAEKKAIEYQVNYYQTNLKDLVLKYIRQAFITIVLPQ